ncbi:protein kinase (plasmid) [Gemmatirosa kalamazoonensis]|uniref:non-specific serine/threonine protein kinase n=1 Tax=Gemmatirosa kalamazoonensis TaxID=861299 RepID=W0RVG5_9BACT|nr:serine/threonine-protein kinase [Gemmatirosa kalamazoonensis]AHG93573.1 protein kinase [Gemmatirosa kalamazoonensis]
MHRDVKPRNVLLVSGAAMVADFGVAKALRDAVHGGSGERPLGGAPDASAPSRDSLTGTGFSVGTPLYMAPEQAAGDPAVDSRADVYALGVTAYEMLTGAAPFADLAPHALLRAKLTELPPPVDAVRPDVPASLAELVQECLAPQPADRPANAAAVVERLSVAASDTGRRRAAALPRRISPARRTAVLASLGALAVVAALGAAWRARTAVSASAAPAAGSPAAGSPASAVPASVVLVVPLVSLSEDSSDAHLAQGVTAHLAAMLSRLPSVRVVSPSRVQGLMREGMSPDEIARRLGASLLVEGTLERAARRVRTTARLVDAKSGTMQWAGAFEHGTEELFALQDDVVAGVANGIRPGAADALRAPNAAAAVPPEAYELVLRGRYLVRTRRPRALREAIGAFERALKLAPSYAPAASALADAYALLPLYGAASVTDALARAATAAERAVALDSGSGEAHIAQARVQDALWQWDDAERSYQRALAGMPRDAGAWQAYGEHRLVRGDAAGAVAALERAARLDSSTAITHASLAVALAAAGQPARARAEASLAVQGDPTLATGWMLMGAVHLFDGRPADALAALSAGLALEPRSALGLGLAGYAAARAGDLEEARKYRARIDGLGTLPGRPLALAHLELGVRDTAAALDALERAVEQHDPFLATEPLWSPLFDEVRPSARFRRVLDELGLASLARPRRAATTP